MDKTEEVRKERARIARKKQYGKEKINGKAISRKITISILKKNPNIIEKKCKRCKTKEDLETHHEVYPITIEEVKKAMKDGKIYYLCHEHHIEIPKTYNGELIDKKKLIKEFLKKEGMSSTGKIASNIKSNQWDTLKYLEELKNNNEVKRTKTPNATYWELNKKEDKK